MPADKRPLKVFLCHAHADRDAVRALYMRLRREGVDVWLDKEKLLPGVDWEYEIRKAVRESDVVIVCLSKQFNQAGFRQKEVRIALEEADKKPEGEIFIIPARLEECDPLKSLERWHWVSLFESDGFQRLILALRVRAEKIGAALRIRKGGATTAPRPTRDELEAKAKAEQAAQEKAAREKIEQEAAEEKRRLEAGELERQKAAKEKADRERLAREATEKAEHERLAREADEKAKRERLARETAEIAERKKTVQLPAAKPAAEKKRAPIPKLNLRGLGIAGFVIISVILALLGGYYQSRISNSSATETLVTITPSSTKTKPQEVTPTFTPVPPTFTPTPGIGSTVTSEIDGMVLVYVPEGEFTMGSDADDALVECQEFRSDCQRSWFTDEEPPLKVDLDAFWVDQTEVTNAMYAKCVADGDCDPPSALSSITHNSYYGNSTYDDYPVIYVNWNQAAAYCKWAGRELPTEAQWEKAARGTNGRTYPWGDIFDGTIVNFCDVNCSYDWANKSIDDEYADVAPVGSYPSGQSIYGALDMAGNVLEWVSSLYRDYPYSATDGREDLSVGGDRALRGGSWSYIDGNVRSANRSWNDPTVTVNYVGFRCSLSHP